MKNDLMRPRTDSKDLIVGLDVGTSKVVVAVAELEAAIAHIEDPAQTRAELRRLTGLAIES